MKLMQKLMVVVCGVGVFFTVMAEQADKKVEKNNDKKTNIQKNSGKKTPLKKVKAEVPKNAVEQDKIAVTIYSPTDGPIIILTTKDLQRLSINGVPQIAEEIIFKYVFFDQATNVMKMDASVDRAEKQIEEIMHHHNLSRDAIKNMFKQFGYTYKQALEEMTRNSLVDQLLHYKIKSRIVLTDEDIEKYYKQHNEYISATYIIRVGFISEKDITLEQVEQWDVIKDLFDAIDWSDEVILHEQEIATERSYIKTLSEGSTSPIEAIEGGYEVIKVIKHEKQRLRTLEESKFEIENILRKQLFEEYLKAYKQELMQEYEIIYHN